MADAAAFLAAVTAAPDDDLPRLVYADWLDERGDPRGEFIRLQLAAARREPWALTAATMSRAAELQAAHAAHWSGPLRDWAYVVGYHRGFPEQLVMPAEDFVAFAAEIVRIAPVRRVTLINVRRWVSALVRLPDLTRLSALHLTGGQIGDEGVEKLAGCPHLSGLTTLRLGGNGFSSAGLAALAASPHLRGLRRLDAPGNDISDWGARALAKTQHLTRLERLDLSGNALSTAAVAMLRRSPNLPRLVEVNAERRRLADGVTPRPRLATATSR